LSPNRPRFGLLQLIANEGAHADHLAGKSVVPGAPFW
jgi:hypothetical protein